MVSEDIILDLQYQIQVLKQQVSTLMAQDKPIPIRTTNTIYVAKSYGHDFNSGLSPDAAKMTIQAGLSAAATLSPSPTNIITVVVLDGSLYIGDIVIPQYVCLEASNAIIEGTITLQDYTFTRLYRVFVREQNKTIIQTNNVHTVAAIDIRQIDGSLNQNIYCINHQGRGDLFVQAEEIFVGNRGYGIAKTVQDTGKIFVSVHTIRLVGIQATGITSYSLQQIIGNIKYIRGTEITPTFFLNILKEKATYAWCAESFDVLEIGQPTGDWKDIIQGVIATAIDYPLLQEINGRKATWLQKPFPGFRPRYTTNQFSTPIPQPFAIVTVFLRLSADSSTQFVYDGIVENEARFSYVNTGVFQANAGSSITTPVMKRIDPIVTMVVYNGASSAIYINNEQVATGNVGTQGLTGLTIGATWSGLDNFSDAYIGLVAIFAGSDYLTRAQQVANAAQIFYNIDPMKGVLISNATYGWYAGTLPSRGSAGNWKCVVTNTVATAHGDPQMTMLWNTRPAVFLNNSGQRFYTDIITPSLSQPFSVVSVSRVEPNFATRHTIHNALSPDNAALVYHDTDGKLKVFAGVTGNTNTEIHNLAVIRVTFNGANSSVYWNGSLIWTGNVGTNGPISRIRIGSTTEFDDYFFGDIAMVAFVSGPNHETRAIAIEQEAIRCYFNPIPDLLDFIQTTGISVLTIGSLLLTISHIEAQHAWNVSANGDLTIIGTSFIGNKTGQAKIVPTFVGNISPNRLASWKNNQGILQDSGINVSSVALRDAQNTFTQQNVFQSLTTLGQIIVQGQATFQSTAKFNLTTTLNQIIVQGNATHQAGTTLNTLTVQGNATHQAGTTLNTLTVQGNATHQAGTTLNTLTVQGNATLNTVTAQGNVTHQSGTTLNTLTVQGNATHQAGTTLNTLTVQGNATLQNKLICPSLPTSPSSAGEVYIGTTGILRAGYNKHPSMMVHKNGTNQTIPDNVITVVTWSAKHFDTNDTFNLSTGRWTPGVPGIYFVSCSIQWAQPLIDQKRIIIQLYRNGDKIVSSNTAISGTDFQGITLTTLVHVPNTTDYLTIRAWQMTGVSQVIIGFYDDTYWSGTWVAPLNG